MRNSMPPAFSFTIGIETSAVSLVRDDGGNWTGGAQGVGELIGSKYGVSAQQLGEYLGRTATAADMRAVIQDVAQAIFGGRFWNRANGDALPAGVDLMTVDHSYNCGPAQGPMVLQRLLGQEADGWIGGETLAAIAAAMPAALLAFPHLDVRTLQTGMHVAADGVAGPVTRAKFLSLSGPQALVVALGAAQAWAYRQMKKFPEDGRGLLSRVDQRVAAAVKLALAAQPEAAA